MDRGRFGAISKVKSRSLSPVIRHKSWSMHNHRSEEERERERLGLRPFWMIKEERKWLAAEIKRSLFRIEDWEKESRMEAKARGEERARGGYGMEKLSDEAEMENLIEEHERLMKLDLDIDLEHHLGGESGGTGRTESEKRRSEARKGKNKIGGAEEQFGPKPKEPFGRTVTDLFAHSWRPDVRPRWYWVPKSHSGTGARYLAREDEIKRLGWATRSRVSTVRRETINRNLTQVGGKGEMNWQGRGERFGNPKRRFEGRYEEDWGGKERRGDRFHPEERREEMMRDEQRNRERLNREWIDRRRSQEDEERQLRQAADQKRRAVMTSVNPGAESQSGAQKTNYD